MGLVDLEHAVLEHAVREIRPGHEAVRPPVIDLTCGEDVVGTADAT